MQSKNYNHIGYISLILTLFMFGGCKDNWVEPEPTTLITDAYKHANAKCTLNGGEWEANCALFVHNGNLSLSVLSEYKVGVGKKVRFSTIYTKGLRNLSSTDSIVGDKAVYKFNVIDVDVSAGNWYLYDSLSSFNYLAIDSISPDSMYVKGRFSGNFKNEYPDGFWQNVGDSFLAPWIEIRDGTFEGRVYSKE